MRFFCVAWLLVSNATALCLCALTLGAPRRSHYLVACLRNCDVRPLINAAAHALAPLCLARARDRHTHTGIPLARIDVLVSACSGGQCGAVADAASDNACSRLRRFDRHYARESVDVGFWAGFLSDVRRSHPVSWKVRLSQTRWHSTLANKNRKSRGVAVT